MRERVEALLRGAYDFRLHTSPEPDGERRVDFLEAGRDAAEAEMAGFTLMKHDHPTSIAAHALRRMYPGLIVTGSIALNLAVGGLNPHAVEASAKLGAKAVWMPTKDAAAIDLLQAVDALGAVIEVARAYDMAVASTHAGYEESEELARRCRDVGLKRLVITDPLARFGEDAASRLLEFDVFIELPFLSVYPRADAGACLRLSVERYGVGRCIVSTDFGQWQNPPPVEGMRMSIAAMLASGMSDDHIAAVVRVNPLAALGLAP